MKIALVVHDLHEQGGHSLYTRVLADNLASRHEVTVFANRCERPPEARWAFQPVLAWRINTLACVQTFPIGMQAMRSRLSEYDIQHAQGYCGGAPNVVTAHICMASYLESLREISARTQASLRMMTAAEARFYRNYRGKVIAISQRVADDLKERYRTPASIRIIPHGVDVQRFKSLNRLHYRQAIRAELGVAPDQTLALYVGDLTKAHASLRELSKAAPEIQFAFVTRSSNYGWEGANVRFLPPTKTIERMYAAADAFVFPTTYDAFGMVAMEAMASGLPVLSSDRAGIVELMDSGRDSVVFPLDEWVEGARQVLRNRDKLLELGRAAEATAQRRRWNAVVTEVETMYNEFQNPCAKIG
jgi:UDP-glucose:(heptosyl)LPS alpha-1,3-glucosyltransferase